ncbi:MAG: hypothetical protein ABI780_07110 [Ardenticatenales bacterium]
MTARRYPILLALTVGLACGLVVAAATTGARHRTPAVAAPAAAAPGRAAVAVAVRRSAAIAFVPNAGHDDPWADFSVPGERTSVLFGAGGLSFRLSRPSAARAAACAGKRGRGVCLASMTLGPAPDALAPLAAGQRAGDAQRGTVDAVAVEFVGGRAGARPEPSARAVTTVTDFRGRPEEWRTVPTYGRLTYRAVWPGIDVAYDGDASRLKQTFTLAPGADAGAIRMAWRGASGLRVGADGSLVVETPAGPIVDTPPVAWQVVDGRRRDVDVRFMVGDDSSYGFAVGAYDTRRPLIIDPAVLVWTGFIGAAGFDRGLGLALGPDGTVWVAGESGPVAYVARLSADGMTQLSLGLFHADSSIAAFDIDVDAEGAAYVTGIVQGDGGTAFPWLGGPDATYNGGLADAFVAKLTPDGQSLVYCGYLGGANVDFGEGIVAGAGGTAVVSGLAQSTEATFPAVIGPDITQNGSFDAFVVKLKAKPTAAKVNDNYAWAGFVGGAGDDVTAGTGGWYSAGHVALDKDGNAYLSNQTTSHEDTFPDGDGLGDLPTFDGTFNGGDLDAYVVKVKADGTGLAYAGYLGGSADEDAKGMAIDDAGAAYLTGDTASADFPVKIGPDLTFNGMHDAYVAKINPDGRSIAWAGYLGGDDDEQGQAVDLGPDGRLYVAGRTESQADTFPAVVGPDLTHNGPDGLDDDADEGDAFVGRLAADIGHADPHDNWDYMGYIGGAQADGAYWLKVNAHGDAFVVGDTDSFDDTFPDGSGMDGIESWDTAQHGGTDAFVARIDWTAPWRPGASAILPWLGRAVVREEAPVLFPVTATPSRTPGPTRTPRPSPTTRPTARPTALITPPAGEEIVFFDDFSDPGSGWDVIDAGGDVWRYVDDEYEVSTTNTGTFTAPFAPRTVSFDDGALEVTLRRTAGSDASGGLVFEGGGFSYAFLIGGARFGLFKFGGPSAVAVIGPAASPFIPTALDVPMRLRVERYGTRVVLLLDGHVLGETTADDLATGGQAGFFVNSESKVPATMRYDDFKVTGWAAGRATPTAGLPLR